MREELIGEESVSISEIFSLKLAAAIRVVALVNVFFNVSLRVIDTYTLTFSVYRIRLCLLASRIKQTLNGVTCVGYRSRVSGTSVSIH